MVTKGTTLKTRKTILNNPRNEYMTTLKVSRGMGNHLLCVRHTKSGANIHIDSLVETSFSAKSPPLAIAPGPFSEAVLGSYERINIHIVVQSTNKAPFTIVHHIKNVVSV